MARSHCARDPSLNGAGCAFAGLLLGYALLVVMLIVLAVVAVLIFATESAAAPFIYPVE
jgi:hypothetical protein